MKKIVFVLFIAWSSIVLFPSCTSSNNNTPLNPNGDSELALLMRAMYEDGEALKATLESGKLPKVMKEHMKMLTAEATEPEKAASPEYKAFAQSYLQTLEALEQAAPEDRMEIYDNLVNSCMTCHQALCPGPMVRIKKLYSSK